MTIVINVTPAIMLLCLSVQKQSHWLIRVTSLCNLQTTFVVVLQWYRGLVWLAPELNFCAATWVWAAAYSSDTHVSRAEAVPEEDRKGGGVVI